MIPRYRKGYLIVIWILIILTLSIFSVLGSSETMGFEKATVTKLEGFKRLIKEDGYDKTLTKNLIEELTNHETSTILKEFGLLKNSKLLEPLGAFVSDWNISDKPFMSQTFLAKENGGLSKKIEVFPGEKFAILIYCRINTRDVLNSGIKFEVIYRKKDWFFETWETSRTHRLVSFSEARNKLDGKGVYIIISKNGLILKHMGIYRIQVEFGSGYFRGKNPATVKVQY